MKRTVVRCLDPVGRGQMIQTYIHPTAGRNSLFGPPHHPDGPDPDRSPAGSGSRCRPARRRSLYRGLDHSHRPESCQAVVPALPHPDLTGQQGTGYHGSPPRYKTGPVKTRSTAKVGAVTASFRAPSACRTSSAFNSSNRHRRRRPDDRGRSRKVRPKTPAPLPEPEVTSPAHLFLFSQGTRPVCSQKNEGYRGVHGSGTWIPSFRRNHLHHRPMPATRPPWPARTSHVRHIPPRRTRSHPAVPGGQRPSSGNNAGPFSSLSRSVSISGQALTSEYCRGSICPALPRI